MKLLLCCSNNKKDLALRKNGSSYFCGAVFGMNNKKLNGKILLECDFESEKIKWNTTNWVDNFLTTKTMNEEELQKRSCINGRDLREYFEICYDSINDSVVGYAIHVKNLHIFEQAKDLNSYSTRTRKVVSDIICDSCTNFGFDCKKCPDSYEYYNLDKLPQNMMYCYGKLAGEEYIIINTKPKELANIKWKSWRFNQKNSFKRHKNSRW